MKQARKNIKGLGPALFMFILIVGGLISFVKYYNLDWRNLLDMTFYENLANPSVRIVKVEEGMRKEQIADLMGQKLGWNEEKKDEFVNAHLALDKEDQEGRYFPKTYMVLKNEEPLAVSVSMFNEFSKQTAKIKKPKATKILNEDTVLKIASIIQREAADKNDMKLISGIIWNRVFKGMKLQIDATLQYAKGDEENGWWGPVRPQDKYIESPYNTYKHTELPPTPIANPGLAAIEAAYNPQKTSCIFYMHDKKHNIHCSATYDGHLANIKRYY